MEGEGGGIYANFGIAAEINREEVYIIKSRFKQTRSNFCSHLYLEDALDRSNSFALKNAIISSSASLLPVSLIPGGSLNSAGLLSSTRGGRSGGGGDPVKLVDSSLCSMVGLVVLDIGSFGVVSSSSSWEDSAWSGLDCCEAVYHVSKSFCSLSLPVSCNKK